MEAKNKDSHSYSRFYAFYVNHKLDNFHWVLVFASGILYLVSRFTRDEIFSCIGLWLFYAMILSFLIHLNQRHLYQFIKTNDNVSFLPVKQIRTINNLLIAVFAAASAILLFILSRLQYDTIASYIIGFFQTVIGAILSIFFHDTAYSGSGGTAGASAWYGTGEIKNSEESFLDILWAGLQKYMEVIIIAIIIIAAIVLFIFIIRKIMQISFNTQTDQHEFVDVEMKREKLSERTVPKKEKLSRFSPDINTRIRRIYIKQISSSLKKNKGFDIKKKSNIVSRSSSNVLSNMTPAEIEAYAVLEATTASRTLHEVYEKARYSSGGASEEDFKNLTK